MVHEFRAMPRGPSGTAPAGFHLTAVKTLDFPLIRHISDIYCCEEIQRNPSKAMCPEGEGRIC